MTGHRHLLALSLCAALSLSACTAAAPRPAGPSSVAPVTTPATAALATSSAAKKLAKIEARYDQAKSFAAIITPALPPERAAMVEAAAMAVDLAFDVARTAIAASDARAARKANEAADRAVASWQAAAGD